MIAETLMTVGPYAVAAAPLVSATAGWYLGGKHATKGVIKKPDPKTSTEVDVLKYGCQVLEEIKTDIHRMYHPVGCHCALCEILGDDTPVEPPVGERCAEPCFACSVITCPRHPDHGPAKVSPPSENVMTIHYYDGHDWRQLKATAADQVRHNGKVIKTLCSQCGERTPNMWVDVVEPHDVYCDGCWNGSASRRNPSSPTPAIERTIEHSENIPEDVKQVLIRQRTAIKNLEAQLMSMVTEHQKVSEERDRLLNSKGIRSAGMHSGGVPLYHLDPIYKHGERQPVRFAQGARDHDHKSDKCEECASQAIGTYKGKVLCRECAIKAATDWGERQLGTFFRKCDDCVTEKAFKIVRVEGDELALCKECYAAYEGLLDNDD